MSGSAMAKLLALAVAAVAGANVARTGTLAEEGRILDLSDALRAVDKDEAAAYGENEEKAPSPPSPDVIDLSSEVSDLQSKLKTMKKMQLLQTAETKAAVASLDEKLIVAQEQAAETAGELQVAEEHVKVLDQELAEEMKRRKAAEEKLRQEQTPALSFLQEESQRPHTSHTSQDFLKAIQLKLDTVQGKIHVEEQAQTASKALLEKKATMIRAKEQELQKLQEENKKREEAAKKKDESIKEAQKQVLAKAAQPYVALSKEGDRAMRLRESQAAEAQMLAKKIGAARVDLDKLHDERQSLQLKMASKQEMLDKMRREVASHKSNVAHLKARKENLNLVLDDMNKAEQETMRKAGEESARMKSYQVQLDEALSKARSQKAELENKVKEMEANTEREEDRSQDQVQQTRALGRQIEQADTELKSVREEVRMMKQHIFQQQSQAIMAQNEIKKEKAALEKEHAEQEAHAKQMQEQLEGKKKEIVDLESEYKAIANETSAAKEKLEEEKAKRKDQEDLEKAQLTDIKEEETVKVKEDAEKLKSEKLRAEFEVKQAEENYTEQVDLMQKKHAKEEQEKEGWMRSQAEIKRGDLREQVESLDRQLNREKTKALDEATVAGAKEQALQKLLTETKEEESRKVDEYHKRMLDLEASLQAEEKASREQLHDAKHEVLNLQNNVLSEEQELAAKQKMVTKMKAEVRRKNKEAEKAAREESDFEAKLAAKVQEAHEMEDKGMLILERNAKLQVEKLKQSIADEEALENEQVSEFQDLIERETKSQADYSELHDLQDAGVQITPSFVQVGASKKGFLSAKSD